MKIKRLIFILIGIVAIMILAMIASSAIMNRNLSTLAQARIDDIDLSKLSDGTYVGEYTALPIKVKLHVTIEGHRMQDIRILEHVNGRGKPAEQIIPEVLQHQSLNVDSISGATYSSKVILHAIANALREDQ